MTTREFVICDSCTQPILDSEETVRVEGDVTRNASRATRNAVQGTAAYAVNATLAPGAYHVDCVIKRFLNHVCITPVQLQRVI